MTYTPVSYSEKRSRAFTLVELMITIVILAILIAVAVPSFRSLSQKNALEAIQQDIKSAIIYARTEAAQRNTFISICPSDDGQTCAANWSNGWIIFLDPDNDADFTAAEADDVILQINEIDNPQYTVSVTKSQGDVDFITFNPQGFVDGGVNTFFKACDAENFVQNARGVFINSSGLIVDSRDTDATADGIHNNPLDSNNNITCP